MDVPRPTDEGGEAEGASGVSAAAGESGVAFLRPIR